MSVRITGGAFAGRLLFGPPHRGAPLPGLRPTAARLRKSLFSVLADEVPGSWVLDLCAGVGTLGFEALSRGAGQCVFVERAPRMCRLIERNAEHLGVHSLRLVAGGAARELRRLAGVGTEFGIVFLDPPWRDWEAGPGLSLLEAAARLGPGVIAAEHRSGWAAPVRIGGGESEAAPRKAFVRTRTLTAGDGAVSLYQRESGEGNPLTPFTDGNRVRFFPPPK